MIRNLFSREKTKKRISETKAVKVGENVGHKVKKKRLSAAEKEELALNLKKVKVLLSRQEYELAKNKIIEGLIIDKFNRDLNIELAGIYFLEKNLVKSEYIYKDLLLIYPNDFEILKKLAHILGEQEKYDLAIKIYEKALRKNKEDLEIINMLAHLTHHKGLFIDTIKYTKEYLKRFPRDVENLYLLATSYKNMGKIDDSIIIYKKLITLRPYEESLKEELNMIDKEVDEL